MKVPSPQVLIAILLYAVSLDTDQPFIHVLCLLIVGGMLLVALIRATLRDRLQDRLRLPQRVRATAGLVVAALLGVLALVAFCGILFVRPPPRLTYIPDRIANAPELAEYRGLYQVEIDPTGNHYAWTQQRLTLLVDFLVRRPITLTVRMRSAAVAGGPDEPVHVVVNGVEVGQLRADPRDTNFQPLSLRFVPPAWGGEQTEIKLLATPFQPAGDRRQLGTMVQAISIDRGEAWSVIGRRSWLVWMLPALALIAGGAVWAARRTGNGRYGLLAIGACLLACGVATALLALILAVGVISIPVYRVWVAGSITLACASLAAAGYLAFQYTSAPEHGGRTIAACARLVAGVRRWTARGPATSDGDGVARAVILRDLATVFVIAMAVRCIWALVVPPWQAPDEGSHYTYTAHIAEQHQIPHPPYPPYPDLPVEYVKSAFLTYFPDLSAAVAGTPDQRLSFLPVSNDYGPARTYRGPYDERVSQAGQRATNYPPLYYLLDAIPYRFFLGGPVMSRLFATRLGSVIMGALSCIFGYLLAYEARRTRLWGFALGLCMALMPMYVFITASVNNDAAMDLFATALIWLMVRAWLRKGLSWRLALAIGIVSGLVLLSKPTAIPVVVVAGVVVLVKLFQAFRAQNRDSRGFLLAMGAYAISVGAVYGPWFLFRYHYYRAFVMLPVSHFARYISGMISVSAASPNLPVHAPSFLAPIARTYSYWSYIQYEFGLGQAYYRWLLIETVWGNFGWLDAPMPQQILHAITLFCIIGVIGVCVQLFLQPARRAVLLLLTGFVAAQAVFLLLIANYYTAYRTTGEAAGNQGRYFFPIIAPALFLLLSGWHHLLRERPLALRLAPLLMLGVQLVGLATILARYYGVSIG